MPVNPRLCSAAPCILLGVILVLTAVVLPGCIAAPSPVSSVNYTPKAGLAPLDVSFSVNASDPGIRVTWDFGDGTTGSGARAEHVYANPGEYTAEARWTAPGGASGNQSGLRVAVYDPQHLPGNYSVGNLSPADMRYLSTLKKKVDLFDQYYIEFTYLNKSHATAMRYTSRDFQFAMKQSLSLLDTFETSPGLGQVRESARVLFTNATDGAYAEFLAGINLEQGNTEEADAQLAQAWPKMKIAKAERDRLVPMLEAVQ
jgi:hypothetical protein